MQKIRFGDMLQLKSGILVHGCNAQGVMGSGIAAQIRKKWPDVYDDFKDAERLEGLQLGKVIYWTVDQGAGLFVASAITQEFYGKDGRQYVSYQAVHDCMKNISEFSSNIGIPVHYPLIGAGFGGGDWPILQAVIDSAFDESVERYLWIFDNPVARR